MWDIIKIFSEHLFYGIDFSDNGAHCHSLILSEAAVTLTLILLCLENKGKKTEKDTVGTNTWFYN